jgi:hypothetical protein
MLGLLLVIIKNKLTKILIYNLFKENLIIILIL